MKFVTWNVNGWRAIERKGAIDGVLELDGDIYCFQEIKTDSPTLPLEMQAEWEEMACVGERKGYSGTMNVAREEMVKSGEVKWLKNGELWKSEILKAEGRICPLCWKSEMGEILVLNIYFPNGGMSETRLQYKMDFYVALQKELKEKRRLYAGIMIGGDINTAHQEIDLARPKENSKNTGFLPMERAWLDEMTGKEGFVDAWRAKNPEQVAYSWWDYKTKARERDVGWRIDYWLVSREIFDLVKEVKIANEVIGSDHVPVVLEMR